MPLLSYFGVIFEGNSDLHKIYGLVLSVTSTKITFTLYAINIISGWSNNYSTYHAISSEGIIERDIGLSKSVTSVITTPVAL